MNLNLPREPKPGQPIRAADIALLIRAVRSLTPVSGVGMMVNHTANGTTYTATARSGGRAGESITYPFLVTATTIGTGEEIQPAVQVAPGTLNDVMPAIDGKPLTGEEGANDEVEYPKLPITGTGYVIAHGVWVRRGETRPEYYTVDSASIEFLTEAEVAAANPAEGATAPVHDGTNNFRALAFVRLRDGALTIHQLVTWSLWYERYGVGATGSEEVSYYPGM